MGNFLSINTIANFSQGNKYMYIETVKFYQFQGISVLVLKTFLFFSKDQNFNDQPTSKQIII